MYIVTCNRPNKSSGFYYLRNEWSFWLCMPFVVCDICHWNVLTDRQLKVSKVVQMLLTGLSSYSYNVLNTGKSIGRLKSNRIVPVLHVKFEVLNNHLMGGSWTKNREIEMTKADSETSSIHGVNILDISLDNISMHPDVNRLLVCIN